MVRPGLENLHHLCATGNLVGGIDAEGVCVLLKQSMSQRGLFQTHSFEVLAELAVSAFHRVGCQGPGCANKAN
eukprot:scaffold455_cov155-Ochromonas_danica.AAC.15